MKTLTKFLKQNTPKVIGAIVGLGTAVFALTASADMASDLSSISSAVGTSFQTNAVLMLTNILPYVVTISVVFLAAKLALRWIKRSAH